MSARSIVFIIVAFHPKMDEFTKLLNTLKEFHVIIVDNGNTLTFDDVGRATLLTQTTNVGYGAGVNIGIHHASGLGATWFVILNQDIQISKDSAKQLIAELKKLPSGVAGPAGGALDPKRWTTMLPSKKSEYITGSCMAIHNKVVGKIGYFYEPYFMYYEDADYSVRARAAGFPLTTVPVDITHEETQSLHKGSRLHTYYMARNHLLFVLRLGSSNVKFYELVRLPKTILEHILRKEKGALLGIRDFLLHRSGEIRKGTL